MNKNTFVGMLFALLIVANFYIYSRIITNDIPDPVYPDYDSVTFEENISDEGTNSENSEYMYVGVKVSDTNSGFLQLVNTSHSYVFDNTPDKVLKEKNVSVYAEKSPSYSVKDINVKLDKTVISALSAMLDDFSAHLGGAKNVIVTQGLRTYDEQKEMLDLKVAQYGPDQTIAQKPGYSEHHTGYALDISTFVNGVMGTFTGENEYAWVHENAHKYGFILRYPEGKEDITGISHESWHFRYVGVPHAQYMYRNNLTLEEYIEQLALYPFESGQLEITDEVTGDVYRIYSVAVTQDDTQIPVPTSATGSVYTLSGDNNGHVIVTVKQK